MESPFYSQALFCQHHSVTRPSAFLLQPLWVEKGTGGCWKTQHSPDQPAVSCCLLLSLLLPNTPGFLSACGERVGRARPERVKDSCPFQPGEVELVTAFSRSAGQVIKMTNEHKSIMKLVFSGNARHERKSTSTRVVGAVMYRMGCPVCIFLAQTHARWHRPFLLPIMFDQDGSASTFLEFLVPFGAELARRWLLLVAHPAPGTEEATPGYRRLGIANGAPGKSSI